MNSSQPVVVARGQSEDALERVVQVLQEAGIRFEVQEKVGSSPEHPSWEWALLVRPAEVDSARRALALESGVGTPPAPPPVPLFDSRRPEMLRVLLMLGSFGLAGWLWLRACSS
jgi:hypothetical protein